MTERQVWGIVLAIVIAAVIIRAMVGTWGSPRMVSPSTQTVPTLTVNPYACDRSVSPAICPPP